MCQKYVSKTQIQDTQNTKSNLITTQITNPYLMNFQIRRKNRGKEKDIKVISLYSCESKNTILPLTLSLGEIPTGVHTHI